MSIYDAIANPMVPNIAQATMQGRGLRMQEQQAVQQQAAHDLNMRLGEQQYQQNELALEQSRNPPRDYGRDIQRIEAFQRGANAARDLLTPLGEIESPEEQFAYIQQNAPTLQALMPDAGLPDSVDEIPHYIAGVTRLASVSGTMAESIREEQRLRLEGNDEVADRMAAMREQEYRNSMVPQVGELAVAPNGERRMIQTQADLQWAIDNGAMPISEATTVVPYEETRIRGDALTTYAAATRTAFDTMDRIEELLVNQGDNIVSFSGALSRVVDTAVSQVSAIADTMGGTAEIDGVEVPDSALRQVSLYQDELTGVASRFGARGADAARLESNIVNLAYLLARLARTDGRLAQTDVKNQMRTITAGGGSANQMLAALGEARQFAITQMDNLFGELNQPVPDWLEGYRTRQPRQMPGRTSTTTNEATGQPRRIPDNVSREAIQRELARRRREQEGG